MKIEIDTVRGFQDYLPPESLKRDAIKEVAKKNFKLFGFQPIETPIIELNELMNSKESQDDEAVSDRYRLIDKGGRELGLRYEFTFQLARIFKNNQNIKLPFKRYQIGEVFRDEPLRAGRMRQFTQCDVDIIGDPSTKADVECVAAVVSTFKDLAIDTVIQINNRKLLNAIIQSVEIRATQEVLRELDKLEKFGADQVKANLRKCATTNQIITLFKLLEKDIEFFKKNAFESATEVQDFIQKCRLCGIKTEFVPTLIRGFAYYTANIFEAVIVGTKTAIAGGGRYDKTIGRYLPNDIPAVGFSFSLEALMGLCKEQLAKLKIEQYPKTLIISLNQDEEAIFLAKSLRKGRVSCSVFSGKPSKALEYANALSIPYVIFVGEEEVEKNKFKLKNMQSGKESMISEKQLIKKLKENQLMP